MRAISRHFASYAGRLSRRGLLGALIAAPALGGCRELIEDVIDSCPDGADMSVVDWIPDVAHPVFAGMQALTPMQGAPRNMLIYYPSAGVVEAPILKQCAVRWPVVLFLHGMPPAGFSGEYYRKWHRLPISLARSGYVVVAPEHNARLIEDGPEVPVADAMADIDFVRNTWADSEWVDKRPTSTVIAGHSYGALIGAHVASTNEVGAFVSLGGPYHQDGRALAALRRVTAPSFLMWCNGGGPPPTEGEDLDLPPGGSPTGTPGVWLGLAPDKYAAVYEGEHFDYLDAADGGTAPRGPCPDIGGMAADLATLFVASNIFSLTKVGVDLRVAPVTLTAEQQAFADGHLATLGTGFTGRGCRLDMRWNVGGATGARSFGLP